jgi:hypothetical protein
MALELAQRVTAIATPPRIAATPRAAIPENRRGRDRAVRVARPVMVEAAPAPRRIPSTSVHHERLRTLDETSKKPSPNAQLRRETAATMASLLVPAVASSTDRISSGQADATIPIEVLLLRDPDMGPQDA